MEYKTGDYTKKYVRPANMLLCLRNELNAVFPGRYTGTDGFVSGYDGPDKPVHASSAHNANDLGHCMAFDFSTTVGMNIDEPTGRALTDYLRTKKNEFFFYLIHDMGPVAAEPKWAGNETNWAWKDYSGPQHADHTHLSLTGDYKWGRPCGLPQTVYDRTVYWGIKEWYASYKTGKPLSASKPTIVKDDELPSVNDVWGKGVKRGGKLVPVIQELADAKTFAMEIKDLLGPVQRNGKYISLKQEVADAKTLGLANAEKLDKIIELLAAPK